MIAKKKELQKLKDFDAYEFVSADGQQCVIDGYYQRKMTA